jgi:hypothetical protein
MNALPNGLAGHVSEGLPSIWRTGR